MFHLIILKGPVLDIYLILKHGEDVTHFYLLFIDLLTDLALFMMQK